MLGSIDKICVCINEIKFFIFVDIGEINRSCRRRIRFTEIVLREDIDSLKVTGTLTTYF